MTGQAQGWAPPGVGQAVGELTFVPEDPREKGRECRGSSWPRVCKPSNLVQVACVLQRCHGLPSTGEAEAREADGLAHSTGGPWHPQVNGHF